jgi:hypothetical protein
VFRHSEYKAEFSENIMCIIQCVNFPSCFGLNLFPLKSDYFDNGDFKNLHYWTRINLVRRFLNARWFHTVVCDYLCMNPDCLRRNPIFSPSKEEKIGSKCNSSQCTLKTCCLVSCRSKDFCRNHHPWPEQLMRLPPIFRVQIYGGDVLWHHNPFLHWTYQL